MGGSGDWRIDTERRSGFDGVVVEVGERGGSGTYLPPMQSPCDGRGLPGDSGIRHRQSGGRKMRWLNGQP